MSIDATKLLSTFDGKVWADEFVRIFREKGYVEPPEFADWMHTWFANAIMAGYDYARKERTERAAAPLPDCPCCKGTGVIHEHGMDHMPTFPCVDCKGTGKRPSLDEALRTTIRESLKSLTENDIENSSDADLVERIAVPIEAVFHTRQNISLKDAVIAAIQEAEAPPIVHKNLVEIILRHIQPVLERAVREAKSRLEESRSEFAILSRACDNWRTWPGEVEGDHDHPDWKVASRAILERNELRAAEKRHADELAAVREECARVIDDANRAGPYNAIGVASTIRSLSPSGALERIENRARLEEHDHVPAHGGGRDLTGDFNENLACSKDTPCKRRADLEAKLAPKETL